MSEHATHVRSVPPVPPRSPRRRGMLVLASVAALALLIGAACGGDDSGDDGAERSTTTTAPEETNGSADPPDTSDGTTTTIDNSQGKPLNETDELIGALAEPSVFAEGLEVRPESVGDGAFQPTICPDQSIEVTWDDQASQGLLRTGEGGTLIVSQAVLAFPDADVADAFLDEYAAAIPACNPAVEVDDTTDIGERMVRITATSDDGPASAAGALVRQGAHVVFVQATGDPSADLAGVVNDDLLTQLVGLLPS